MNREWKYKEKAIGKSGDLLLARRSEDAAIVQLTIYKKQ